MGFKSKYKGFEIENLLDKMSEGGGGGITIVDSIDKLDPNAELGNLACVVEPSSIQETSFRNLYQPDASMLDQTTGTLTAPELLSSVSSVSVLAPQNVDSLVESMVYLVTRDFSMASQNMAMVQFAPQQGVMAMTITGGYDTMQQFVLAEFSQDTMSYTIHNDQVDAFNAVLANGMDWCYFGDSTGSGITEEQFATIDLFVKAVADISSKAHVYLKKDNWEELYAEDFEKVEKLASDLDETKASIPTKLSQLENDAELASKYNLPHGRDVFFVPGENFIAVDPFIKSVYKGYIKRGYLRPTVTNGGEYYEFLCVLDENSMLGYYSGAYKPFASQELALGVYKITLEFISSGCVFHRLEKLDTIGGLSLLTYRNSEDNPTILLDRFSGDGIYYNGAALTSNKHTPDGFGEHIYVDFGIRRNLVTVNQLIRVSSTIIRIDTEFSYEPNLLTANFTCLEEMAPGAFQNCPSLQTVSLGSKLKTIPNNAFSDCSSLNSIIIPESVTKIGDSAFAYCSSITNIIIPDSVTEIGQRAFQNCSSLSEIVLSNSLTTLPEYSLHGLNVRSLYLPPSIKYIEGQNALSDSIDEIHISDLEAFLGIAIPNIFLKSLYDLYLNGELVTELDIVSQTKVNVGVQLNKCKSLKHVSIETPSFESTNYSHHGFCYCPQLETVKLNVSENSFWSQSSMFVGCERLKKFEGPFASSDSKCLMHHSEIVSFAPYGIREYTTVDSATSIGPRCFAECKELERLNLQSSITSIEGNFIENSTNLSFVNFENHTSIPSLTSSSAVPESCVFIVPDTLYSTWILATNWAKLADQIIKKSDWDAQNATE